MMVATMVYFLYEPGLKFGQVSDLLLSVK